jgi:AAA domain
MTESTTLEQLVLPPGRWSPDAPDVEHAGMACDGIHVIDDLWLGIDSEGRICVQRPGGEIVRRYVAEHSIAAEEQMDTDGLWGFVPEEQRPLLRELLADWLGTAPAAPAFDIAALFEDFLASDYHPEPLECPEYEPYRLYTEEDLGRFPPVEWWIRGWLAKGELHGFYGKGGTFKSFVALDWACHLAAAGHPVVYIVAEGASGTKARIAAWKKASGVEELAALRLMPSSVRLQDVDSVATFIAALKSQLDGAGPALIVVDTLARNFVGGNENSPEEMGLFVEGCERVRRAFDCAVLVIHHTTVDGKRERGTEALRNATFAMHKFTRSQFPLLGVTVSCDRMKDARPPVDVALAPEEIDVGWSNADGDPVTSLCTGWPYDADAAVEAGVEGGIRAYLAEHGPTTQRVLEAEVDGRATEVRRVAKALAADPESGIAVEYGPRNALVYSLRGAS